MRRFILLLVLLLRAVFFEFGTLIPVVTEGLSGVMFLAPGALLDLGSGRRVGVVARGGLWCLVVPLLLLLRCRKRGIGSGRFVVRGEVNQMLLNLSKAQFVLGCEVVNNVPMVVDEETEEEIALSFVFIEELGEELAIGVGGGPRQLVELEPLGFASCNEGGNWFG